LRASLGCCRRLRHPPHPDPVSVLHRSCHIIIELHARPNSGRTAERLGKSDRHFGGHAAPLVHEFGKSIARHAKRLRSVRHTQPEGLKALLAPDRRSARVILQLARTVTHWSPRSRRRSAGRCPRVGRHGRHGRLMSRHIRDHAPDPRVNRTVPAGETVDRNEAGRAFGFAPFRLR
jgi:hypothetical protein